MTDKNPTAVASSQPTSVAGELGISAQVKAQIPNKVDPSIRARIDEYLARKARDVR